MNAYDKEAHDKLKALCGDMQTMLDNIVLGMEGKNYMGIGIVTGYLQGVKESLDSAFTH